MSKECTCPARFSGNDEEQYRAHGCPNCTCQLKEEPIKVLGDIEPESPVDVVEKLFGKAPESGYKFTNIEVRITDNDMFKGFGISWEAQGIGFGEVFFGWGIDLEYLKEYPHRKGLHLSTECMSDEFVHAVIKEAMPKIVDLLLKKRTD